MDAEDPKQAVNWFLQKFCRRPLNKEDCVYVTTKFQQGFQCIVKLNCVDGQEFAGQVSPNQKEAEKSAATQVLNHYAGEIAAMGVSKTGKGKKRPAGVDGVPGVQDFSSMLGLGVDDEEEPAAKAARLGEDAAPDAETLANLQLLAALSGTSPEAAAALSPGGFGGARSGPSTAGAAAAAAASKTSKADLNTTVAKIMHRAQKGDVLYECAAVAGGFQATVRLPGMSDPWSDHVWAGEVHSKKCDAEQSAAGIALADIQADPELMEMANAPPKQKMWKPPGFKGKGFGKGFGKDFGFKGWGKGFKGGCGCCGGGPFF